MAERLTRLPRYRYTSCFKTPHFLHTNLSSDSNRDANPGTTETEALIDMYNLLSSLYPLSGDYLMVVSGYRLLGTTFTDLINLEKPNNIRWCHRPGIGR
jgi:hypothetical protein